MNSGGGASSLANDIFFPLASVVPLFPQLQLFQHVGFKCGAGIGWHKRGAVSVGTLKLPLLLLFHPCPPDCPTVAFVHALAREIGRLKTVYFLVCGTRLQD